MTRRNEGGDGLPWWVWVVLGVSFLWALIWYLGFSLPAHWAGV